MRPDCGLFETPGLDKAPPHHPGHFSIHPYGPRMMQIITTSAIRLENVVNNYPSKTLTKR
eukprot:7709648-Karenia_brevis.AAC.1